MSQRRRVGVVLCLIMQLSESLVMVPGIRKSRVATRVRAYNGQDLPSAYELLMQSTAAELPRNGQAMEQVFRSLPPWEWSTTWALLAACGASGLWLRKRGDGIKGSPMAITLLVSFVLANLGVLPSFSPAYRMVFQQIAALAIPLLLFDTDLEKAGSATRKLFPAYGIATLATVIGTVLAWPVLLLFLEPASIEPGCILASALCARHIGGALNYQAVCDACAAPSSLIATGIVADNIIIAPFYILLFRLASTGMNAPETDDNDDDDPPDKATASNTASALALAFACIAPAAVLGPAAAILPGAAAAALLVSGLGRSTVKKITPAARILGLLITQLYVATIGATSGTINNISLAGIPLAIFSILQLSIHFAVLKLAHRIFPNTLDNRSLALASSAAVGGPSTALAMCASQGWTNLILPALLIAFTGYFSGTFIALSLFDLFYRSVPF